MRCGAVDGTDTVCNKQAGHGSPCRFESEEIVICSAVLVGDYIIRGHRHNDCLRTLHDSIALMQMLGGRPPQGFVTSRNRFVDRVEGLYLQERAGIESVRGSYQQELYSEDLY